MNDKEILIILNRLRNVVENDNIDSKLILTQTEASCLLNYLLKLRDTHNKEKNLINKISYLITKENED